MKSSENLSYQGAAKPIGKLLVDKANVVRTRITDSIKNYVVDDFPRYNDTEAKILEDIASKIKDPNIKGEVNLFTELDTCQSCTNIILEFRAKYPNIKLNIFTNNTVF